MAGGELPVSVITTGDLGAFRNTCLLINQGTITVGSWMILLAQRTATVISWAIYFLVGTEKTSTEELAGRFLNQH